ncbi:MAG: peptidoglycan editing factor PgeF [Undibacterium sp.]|nr:peptidoglycan editing factor PgeF [Undibacterium sp.]
MRPEFSVISPQKGWFPPNVHAFSTLREGGVSLAPYQGISVGGGLNLGDHVGDDSCAVARNREIFSNYLPSHVTFLTQVHGIEVVDAAQLKGNQIADGCVTSKVGVICAVLTADCLPVLLSDRHGTVVAAVHAGWRGLASGILQVAINKMRGSGANEILAWMGPAIGPAQFEVGKDVLDAFPQLGASASQCFVSNNKHDKYLANIYLLARHALAEVGVVQVDGGDHCTVTERDKFYSYRRDRETGRMASVIWMD